MNRTGIIAAALFGVAAAAVAAVLFLGGEEQGGQPQQAAVAPAEESSPQATEVPKVEQSLEQAAPAESEPPAGGEEAQSPPAETANSQQAPAVTSETVTSETEPQAAEAESKSAEPQAAETEMATMPIGEADAPAPSEPSEDQSEAMQSDGAAAPEPASPSAVAAEPPQLATVPKQAEQQQAVGQPVAPSFDIVRVEPNGDTVIAGRAAPGSKVTLFDGDLPLGSVTADANGDWVLLPASPLESGGRQLSLTAETADGQILESSDVLVIAVPERPTAAPVVAAQEGETKLPETMQGAEEEAPLPLAVLTPREGEGASQVLQQPEGEGISDRDLVLSAIDYDLSGRVIISGRAVPGARILLYLDNQSIGQTLADEDGRRVLAPASPVTPGLHRLRVDQVDENTKVLARIETPFARAEMMTEIPGEQLVIVQPGNSLWRIARQTLGDGIRYAVIYQANADQIRNPDLIYPGQIFMVPETN